MDEQMKNGYLRFLWLTVAMLAAIASVWGLLMLAQFNAVAVQAAPIEPPTGYPKLNQSRMTVDPSLANVGGARLEYVIEIINTGAYTASGVSMVDELPVEVTFHSASTSSGNLPVYEAGEVSWFGEVGFDSTVLITLTVDVAGTFEGILENQAVISHPDIDEPIWVSAETVVTDDPLLTITKSSTPEKPGPGKLLTYMLEVSNIGQPANGIQLSVSDQLPDNTSYQDADPDGSYNDTTEDITWNRTTDLATGASTVFTFSVDINSVISGTVISNVDYGVSADQNTVPASGEVYTVTVVDPILYIAKTTQPDPPGSNREMTYTLTVLNKGSEATDLVVNDAVPEGVAYLRGGDAFNENTGVVSWYLDSLPTDEWAVFEYVVYIDDVADVDVINTTYDVCGSEGVCATGEVYTSPVKGPTFEVEAYVDPIAHKPGGGNSPVTPTLVIRNTGPGNAIAAEAKIAFGNISVSNAKDLIQIPYEAGTISKVESCGLDKCYQWIGNLAYNETITITTEEPQSTIGGEEGTTYTATIAISDTLGPFVTEPISATAIGLVTHYANLIPTKTAPPVIGAGQMMTYTINVFNSGLSTEEPPYPVLTETLPAGVALLEVSDDGSYLTISDTTSISWTLPAMSTAESLQRSFAVLVDSTLVSGTQIVNDQYSTAWYESEITGTMSIVGIPVTTTVKEVGLVDSFKTVTPTLAQPGEGIVLNYNLNVVNSSPLPLTGVRLSDLLPWEHATYQRNAGASSGQIADDIVSIDWQGSLAPYSSELITFSVVVDDYYEGPITNTATITHPSLLDPVEIQAVAYITNKPVLQITKTDSPDPVKLGDELEYTIRIKNLGQQATNLIITDTIPVGAEYVMGSTSGSGQYNGTGVRWTLPVLAPGNSQEYYFRVRVSDLTMRRVVNDSYAVSSAEGVSAYGEPVWTEVRANLVFLPLVNRQ